MLDPAKCTHLAAPAMVRTQKFLCAIAAGPTVLSSDFIDYCIDKGELPPVDKYLLQDKENEKRFDLKLEDVVSRAERNNRRLLRSVAVYCTADIANGPETYKAIVEANGGTFTIYRARGGSTMKPMVPSNGARQEKVYMLTSTKPEEKRLWPKFAAMARAGGMDPKIVHTEWLLDTAMAQQIKWDDAYLVEKN